MIVYVFIIWIECSFTCKWLSPHFFAKIVVNIMFQGTLISAVSVKSYPQSFVIWPVVTSGYRLQLGHLCALNVLPGVVGI